jgi:hypothetical protein
VCPNGLTVCGNACVATATDPNNCGRCNNFCAFGAACQTGTCVCPNGLTVCANQCVDESSDPKHCGGCNAQCALGGVCTNAVCNCPSGAPTLCGSVCTDLTVDANNCGQCGHACTSGACNNGACKLVTTQISSSTGPGNAMAVDATTVYWGTPTAVLKAPLAGGAATTLAIGNVSDLALSGANIYYIDGGTYAIKSVPIGGGAVVTLAPSQAAPAHLATDGTSVFWTNGGDGTVKSVPVGGGTVTTIANNQTISGYGPLGIALSGANVYWGVNGALRTAAKTGGAVTVVTQDGMDKGWLAVDTQNAYYGTLSSTLDQAPLAGGSRLVLANNLNDSPQGQLGLDASYVYMSPYDGTITRVPIGGGPALPIVNPGSSTLQTIPWTVAVDAANIYWVDYGGNVWKVTKP